MPGMIRLALVAILLGFAVSVLSATPVFETDFSTNSDEWKIEKDSAQFGESGLRVKGSGGVRFEGDAAALADSIRDRGEITVSVWFRPENLSQEGPARIFTFSKNSSERNVTIGQEGDRYEIRLRTTKVGKNGTPGLQTKSGSVRLETTHLVFSRQRDGRAEIFLDGRLAAEGRFEGDLSNWDRGLRIGVGDEFGGNRTWKGELLSVAVHDEAMSAAVIEELFAAGPGEAPKSGSRPSKTETDPSATLFETKITGILTRHCLECHDTATGKGDLDLSRKLASHNEDGILVAGDVSGSLLWESIEHDDMPHDRPPLSAEEKSLIRAWIEGGAAWTVDFVDPAIYARESMPRSTRSRRLTRDEYVATVRDVFGVDLSEEARQLLPPDVRADGFSNTAYNLVVDLDHVEAYAELAAILAGRLDTAAFAKRFTGARDLEDKTMIALVESMGESVLRGRLDGEETALYRGVATTVALAGGDFDEAVAAIVEAMVQSPRFLYRIEEIPRGKEPRLADDFEMASRLSYAIWGSSPDGDLLKKAREGRLRSADALGQEAARMIQDPRARERSLAFVSDWLHLDRLSHLQPSPRQFPDWDPALAADMRAETLAYFTEVVWNRDLRMTALLDTPVGFFTQALARHYGIDSDKAGEAGKPVDLSSVSGRGGILTQGSILTVGGDEASMVTRGLFVLNDLLRGVIQDPPPCVDTTPVASKPGLTQRAVAMERVGSKACGACHMRFEPLAFGLEKFDGLGTYHETDHHGNELREDGEILFPGAAEPVAFETVEELMSLLASSDRVAETLTWKMVQWVMGRPLGAADAADVLSIHAEAKKAGGRYTDLVAAIVRSELFRYSYPDSSPES